MLRYASFQNFHFCLALFTLMGLGCVLHRQGESRFPTTQQVETAANASGIAGGVAGGIAAASPPPYSEIALVASTLFNALAGVLHGVAKKRLANSNPPT